MPEQSHPALPFRADLQAGLDNLATAGLRRELRVLPTGLVNFGSNDYLGLSRDSRVVEAAASAAHQYGAGSTSSRLIAGTTELVMRLETRLAAFKGQEMALVFPTGYQAAVGTISALAAPGDELYLDKLDHASLIDGARLSGARLHTWPHGHHGRLRRLLDRPAKGRRLIVTDGLFSMDGDLADLPELGELAERFGAALMVDEAHATGCLGASGRGSAELLGCEHQVHISMGTFSKALGAQGGFIAAGREVIEHLVNRSRAFIYTTAPAPALLGAALAALAIVESAPERRARLANRSAHLRQALRDAGFDTGTSVCHIVPVVLGDNEVVLAAMTFLAEQGFYAPAVRYPTVPRSSARLRLSVSSEHPEADIDALVVALTRWRNSRA
jgi:8-amino-7-oxononanoate synthase